MTGFEAKVSDIARAVAEPAEGQSPDNIAERLYGALADTRGAHSRRQQVANDIDAKPDSLLEADVAAAQARNALNELVQQAGCQTTEQLPEIEGRGSQKAKPATTTTRSTSSWCSRTPGQSTPCYRRQVN